MTPPPGNGGGDDDYEVGYRKPPKHSRFQPGRSGNPEGRPKGSKNLKTLFERELSERIVVREDGRAMEISRLHAIVKSWVLRAMKGDAKAMSLLINMKREFDAVEAEEEHNDQVTTDALVKRLNTLIEQSRREEERDSPPDGSSDTE
jgi:uncharacterized protein DUF5681